MKTLSQHISIFRTFANNHGQLHSFGWGDSWEFNSSGVVYPTMWVQILPSQVNENIITDNYDIWFMDYVRHDEINELEALSAMKQCALDLLAYLDKSQALGNSSIVGITHSMEPYTERLDDRVSGWVLSLTIEQNFNYDYCNIP